MRNRTAVLVLTLLSTGLFAVSQETSANGKVPTRDEDPKHAVHGGGTKNFIPLWLSATKLGNSIIFQSTAGNVGISTTKPGAKLDVNGAINAATSFDLAGVPFAFGSFSNQNVFLGFAGNFTTTGTGNTAVGQGALSSGNGNGQNTAVGQGALSSDTGPLNTAIGSFALFPNTTGADNVACGAGALANNTTGDDNTASGLSALRFNISGSDNTALGFLAGPDPGSPNLFNATAIGAHATVSESNAVVLGGTGPSFAVKVGIGTATPANVFTIARGAGEAISDGWDTYSSRRWKTNIHTLDGALGKVEQLRGVSYDLRANGKHEVGVIAEEVGKVVPEVVTWDKNGKDADGVDYSRLTALLIEATKAQQLLIHKQQVQIARLTSQVRAIQTSLKTSGRAAAEVRRLKALEKPQPRQPSS
jgi:hypothetical protein